MNKSLDKKTYLRDNSLSLSKDNFLFEDFGK